MIQSTKLSCVFGAGLRVCLVLVVMGTAAFAATGPGGAPPGGTPPDGPMGGPPGGAPGGSQTVDHGTYAAKAEKDVSGAVFASKGDKDIA